MKNLHIHYINFGVLISKQRYRIFMMKNLYSFDVKICIQWQIFQLRVYMRAINGDTL